MRPNGEYEEVNAPYEFSKGIKRDATDPLELLSPSRLNNELLPNGSLFILKKLLPKGFSGIIDGSNFKAEVSTEILKITFCDKTFVTKI